MAAASSLEKKFTKLNNIIGWLVFLIACFVYGSTIEPTVSFCMAAKTSPYTTSWKSAILPVSLFCQLLQHCVSLLSFGNVHNVAPIINRACATYSALCYIVPFLDNYFFC